MKIQNNTIPVNSSKSSHLVKRSGLFFVFFLISYTLSGCGGGDKHDKPQFTKLDDLLEKHEHTCSKALANVGNELILSKEHFLQLDKIPESFQAVQETNTNDENKSSSGAQQMSVLSSNQQPLTVSGVLLYNDRPAHVHFDAYPTDSSNSQCVVKYQLDYHFTEPCMTIREEAFKKWNQIGMLGKSTRFYVHKRKPNKKVYLTDLERGIQCLVSVKNIEVLPN